MKKAKIALIITPACLSLHLHSRMTSRKTTPTSSKRPSVTYCEPSSTLFQVLVSLQQYSTLLTCADYPLPPNEDKTEVLRVVVRQTLSLDMIDRLVTDICQVTEVLMKSDTVDVGFWQPTSASVEKEHSSSGLQAKDKHKARRPMRHGVHRSVC